MSGKAAIGISTSIKGTGWLYGSTLPLEDQPYLRSLGSFIAMRRELKRVDVSRPDKHSQPLLPSPRQENSGPDAEANLGSSTSMSDNLHRLDELNRVPTGLNPSFQFTSTATIAMHPKLKSPPPLRWTTDDQMEVAPEQKRVRLSSPVETRSSHESSFGR